VPHELKLKGRAWVIAGPDGMLIHDIDTDQIFHNSHLAITDMAQMGQHAFGNLKGWEDFPGKARSGDIIIVGRNFGCGSSRQQAVDCFRSLGVSAVVGASFGAIYKRNAVNSGLKTLSIPSMEERCPVKNGNEVEIDLAAGTLSDEATGVILKGSPASQVELDIYDAGGLFEYGRKLGA
jgi:3-isopropylmalate/(R)-2-methylmalate dehydratase small subunit